MSSGSSNLKEGVKGVGSLAPQIAQLADKYIFSDVPDTTGVIGLHAIRAGASGNDLKVEVTNPGPDDCELVVSMGGAGDNTLTIALGRTVASTNSAKNTLTLIAAAVNAVTMNKKIDAEVLGASINKISLTAVAANFTGGVTPAFSGDGFDRSGYNEVLIILSTGAFDAGSDVTVVIEESDDNDTFTAIAGASFGVIDDQASATVFTGVINLTEVKQWIRAASVVNGLATHSVVFIVSGGQYRISGENTHTFTV